MFGQMRVTRMFQLSKLETVDEVVAKLDLPSRVARPMDGRTRPGANSSRKASSLRTVPAARVGDAHGGVSPYEEAESQR